MPTCSTALGAFGAQEIGYWSKFRYKMGVLIGWLFSLMRGGCTMPAVSAERADGMVVGRRDDLETFKSIVRFSHGAGLAFRLLVHNAAACIETHDS